MNGKVGFVGLGIMGTPMARNLMQAGYDLLVYNRSAQNAARLAGEGAEVVDNLEELAEKSSPIITMLPGPPEVEEVIKDLLEGTREGSLLVDMSTSSPLLARELARNARERGVGMLDAPVSGGDIGAIEGTLSIMAGGEREDFDRASPLFEIMGGNVVHVGEAGAGQLTKAANQIVVAIVMEAISEALLLAERSGVEPRKLIEALSGGLASSKIMELKREKFLSHEFTPGGKVVYHLKDLGIALETAGEYGVSLPVTALVKEMFGSLVAKERGGWDHSAILTLVEELSGEEG